MKRITQLFLIILALTAVNLAAAPQKGGSQVQSKAGGWYICNSDGLERDCGTISSCACRAACEEECHGPCEWDGSCAS